MYNLAISMLAGLVIAVLVHLLGFPWLAGILPGILVMVGLYVVLARRIANKFQVLAEQAQNVIQGQAIRTEKDRLGALDKSIKILEQGFQYEKWQHFIGPEVHANVGMLHYLKKDFDAAKPHLEKSSNRNWMAKTMLGCLYFQSKQYDPMKVAFEDSVQHGGKKESMAWAVYGWCLWKIDKGDEALALLGRAVTENPSDEKLKKLQAALQNDRRLKMNLYEPMWWQFGLEKPPVEMVASPFGSRYPRGRRR
jgi:tetratricopeptide (TPR) repeat protein